MSGLAFSALVIFCLLIPGLVFQYRYYRSAAGTWATSDTIDTDTPRALLLAILFCIPIHAIWGVAITFVDSTIPVGRINYRELLALLQGNEFSKAPRPVSQLNTLLLWKFAGYVWSQVLAAFYLGGVVAQIADKHGWNKWIALSGQGAFWHKVFRYPDNEPDGIIVSLTLTLGDTTYLYYGLLAEYELTVPGDLQRIVFQGAVRRKIGGGSDDGLYDIPGEYLVVNCENVETVDIDYFWIDQADNGHMNN